MRYCDPPPFAYVNLTSIPPMVSLHPDYRDAFPFSTRAQLEAWLLLNTKETAPAGL